MGSSFIRTLLDREDFKGEVVNFDLLTYAGNPDNLTGYAERPSYTFYRGNIQDQEFLEEVADKHDIDVIVHFAAETHVDRSIHSPRAFIETNVLGTHALLELVRSRPSIRFHLISTDEVYGSLTLEGQFTEDSPYRPRSPYSASKASADHIAQAYAETYGLQVTISHASNNYGPCQYPEKFIPLMILNCLEGKPLPVYGTGENIRDWMFVQDHSHGVLTLLEKGKIGDVYNLASNEERSNLSLLHLIIGRVAKITETDPEVYRKLIAFVKDRPGHDFRYSLKADKMKSELGITSTLSLEEGLDQTIRWYIENTNWVERVKNKSYMDWMDQQYESNEVKGA